MLASYSGEGSWGLVAGALCCHACRFCKLLPEIPTNERGKSVISLSVNMQTLPSSSSPRPLSSALRSAAPQPSATSATHPRQQLASHLRWVSKDLTEERDLHLRWVRKDVTDMNDLFNLSLRQSITALNSKSSFGGGYSLPGSERKSKRMQQSKMVGEAWADGEEVVIAVDNSEEEYAKQWGHKPRRIALFVEPSPFAYVCGYKNRFQNFIRYLREMGDEVLIVTTHKGLPRDFYGAKIIGSWSFPCPWYRILPLSLALSPRIIREISCFKPDIIHASSPGVMVFGALIIAKMLSVPIVMSYHTHVPIYIPKYTFSWLVTPMWMIIKFLHRAADLTLVTSHALGKELKAAGAAAADRIRVWRKGVDSDNFHPRFKSHEMRMKLTDGEVERPLLVHVGRLGAEKNLDLLKKVMDRIPEARLAFIGDGPYRADLEQMFKGNAVVFTGMLQGEELSKAYASGDLFVTPSESETLGLVVLEAMASGIPVVVARAGGIPDIVSQDGETGFLFTPGDVDDCVKKVKALIDSPELRHRIGAAGRADVENYDWRASTKQVRNEYSTAVWFWGEKRKQPLWNRFSWWFSYFHNRSSKLKLETSA